MSEGRSEPEPKGPGLQLYLYPLIWGLLLKDPSGNMKKYTFLTGTTQDPRTEGPNKHPQVPDRKHGPCQHPPTTL